MDRQRKGQFRRGAQQALEGRAPQLEARRGDERHHIGGALVLAEQHGQLPEQVSGSEQGHRDLLATERKATDLGQSIQKQKDAIAPIALNDQWVISRRLKGTVIR
jgi:hypothetical protein